MKMISLHDNIVTGYAVSCEEREVILHTEYPHKEPKERTDVIFCGVEAYHIVGDNMQSVLFDIADCNLEEILETYSSEFQVGVRYAWPGPWNESMEASKEYLMKTECKGWMISSSYGMAGFVIGKTRELRVLKNGQQTVPPDRLRSR
jgi:hypothetical protein